MDNLAIDIFTRAPVAGSTKTRLIPAYGARGAAEIHLQLLQKTVATAALLGVPVSLWVVDQPEHPAFQALREQYPLSTQLQTGANLGERMANALTQTRKNARKVLLVGSDCATHSRGSLEAAAQALSQAPMVFTPAEDGGYVLVGASGVVEPQAFHNIDWGTNRVMQQSRERLSALQVQWLEMPTTWDVDEPEDALRAGFTSKQC